MSWKRVWRIGGEVVFWCLVVAFFVWVGSLRGHNEKQRTVGNIRIVLCDSLTRSFVTPEAILTLLNEAGYPLYGQSVEELDLGGINDLVESHSFVRHSRSYIDYDGILTIELYQRQPVVRIITDKGFDFYLSNDMYVLPIQPHATLNLPIVTGDVPLPVEMGYTGSLLAPLEQLKSELHNAELANQERIAQRQALRRTEKEARDETLRKMVKGLSDEEAKKVRLQARSEERRRAERQAEQDRVEDAPYQMAINQMSNLKKKYEENYNFLTKLINFVGLTERSAEWQGQFVQMTALRDKQASRSQYFIEPRFELTPRHGNYTLEFGTLDNAEEKLQRWQTFISASVVDTRGGVVSVEYDGQVLWRAPKSENR